MKVKVLKEFKDVHTKELYAAGKTIIVSEERYAEINKNLPRSIKQIPEQPVKGKARKGGA